MFRIFLSVAVFLVLLPLFSSNSTAASKEKKHIYPLPDVAKGIDANFYSTEGFVIAASSCAPCPIEGACAPCGPGYVKISDKFSGENVFLPDSPVVTLYINDTQKFEVGKKYMFLVQVVSAGNDAGGKYHNVTDYHEIPESKEDGGKK